MPIYEYVCQECRENFEVISTSCGAARSVQCPACRSANVKKSMSAPSLRPHSSGPAAAPSCGSGSGCPHASKFS